MKKKLISVILSITIIITSLAVSFSAFASSQEIYLNVKTTTMMSGKDDLEWFYFTPEQSGLYSFLSYNTPRSDGYLFIKEMDPVTYEKKYIQLAYSSSDPNYLENDHNSLQFCLTYHLEAGVTYYFAAGWWLNTQTRSQFTVMLRCDSYDSDAISSIEILEIPDLDAYTDGEWRTDGNSQKYYHYSTSKIISNAKIKVNFSNGTSSTVIGKSDVNGYQINYIDNQYNQHWYPRADENFKGNTITVQILNKTATAPVNINIGARYSVYIKVLNFANKPVANADITIDGMSVGHTDSTGFLSFYYGAGYYEIGIETDTSINYSSKIVVGTSATDLRDTPFVICNCDYVRDGYINAKDYSYIIKNLSGENFRNAKEEFGNAINFSKDKY